ncbi:hypothetical protein [Sphingomonas solaris]|uniref:Uncharacterized protein n=1 Tax=Alterirhizorhabdus solaris TaxID=2529389 RepID=A0A558R048_9SPHN|nr:hypothetical protein [Sphingomonas solaris]TVV72756.1 hypothetical protein FOY91_13580 [Sphingomonas solaris]
MADPTTQRNGEDMIEMSGILAHPATSYWLRDAIVSAIERDPFDAERDAIVLAELLGRRLDALVARHFPL